ncbi:MAG: hypothetical protein SF097_04070, partial [Acidobacteriota bacterium]|nr:hypothetical protein [Acidobacteriota bacterium]
MSLPTSFFFAPEAQRILAGGERSVTTGNNGKRPPSPERASDEAWSVALSGLETKSRAVPVVPQSL